MELAPKAVRSGPCETCSGTHLDWRNLDPQGSEELARVRAYREKMYPSHPTDPYGLQRMEHVRTQTGVERLCNQLFRECLGEPTRAELRSERAQMRDEQRKLRPEQVDKNAYRHPQVRERCPRDMPGRRPPGWAAINFVLPRRTILGLSLLVRAIAQRQRAEHLNQPYGLRRKYPRTKNYFIVEAANDLFRKYGLPEFCVEENEPIGDRVARFAVRTD